MSQNFVSGDYLVFQLESGYALLRILAIDEVGNDSIWHLAAYDEFFLDVESAESHLGKTSLVPSVRHIALSTRAFESTQVARLLNKPLGPDDLAEVSAWRESPDREVSDRSVRLMLGLR